MALALSACACSLRNSARSMASRRADVCSRPCSCAAASGRPSVGLAPDNVLHQLGLHIVVAAVTGGKLVGSLDGRGGGGYKCCRPDRAPLLWTERSRAAADGRRPADQLQILARHGFLDDRSLEFTRELKIA
eukprot:scaffold4043_cov90-Isochrysis_galbana.AAC.5